MGVASFVALIAEKEEADNAKRVEFAARAVTNTILALCNGREVSPVDEPLHKHCFILWEHDRAKRCIWLIIWTDLQSLLWMILKEYLEFLKVPMKIFVTIWAEPNIFLGWL